MSRSSSRLPRRERTRRDRKGGGESWATEEERDGAKAKGGKGGYGVSDVQLSSGSGCLVKVGGERRGAGEGGDHGRGTKRKGGDEGEEMVV